MRGPTTFSCADSRAGRRKRAASRSRSRCGRNIDLNPTNGPNPKPTDPHKPPNWFQSLGPGLITGAADDDPSGISTYSVAGASLGYAPLWTALFSFPLMAAVQLMCARLGMVTGRGLAG